MKHTFLHAVWLCATIVVGGPIWAQSLSSSWRIEAQLGVAMMNSQVEDPADRMVGGWFPIHTQQAHVAYAWSTRTHADQEWYVELGVRRSAMAMFAYPRELPFYRGVGDDGATFLGPSIGVGHGWSWGGKTWFSVYGRVLWLFTTDDLYPATLQWSQVDYPTGESERIQLGAETKLIARNLPGAQAGIKFRRLIFRDYGFLVSSLGGGTGFRRIYQQDLQYREVSGGNVGPTSLATTWFRWTHLEVMLGIQLHLRCN